MPHNPNSNMQKYIVHSSEYTDMTFQTPIPETEVIFGPFDNYNDAYKIWRAESQKFVDYCTHKAIIKLVR